MEVLTSQIYFAGDERLASAGVPDALIARSAATVDAAGTPMLEATHLLVIDRRPGSPLRDRREWMS